jgi:hypothetical protein
MDVPNDAEQAQELEALTAIYQVQRGGNGGGVVLMVDGQDDLEMIEPGRRFRIRLLVKDVSAVLTFRYTDGYPDKTAPDASVETTGLPSEQAHRLKEMFAERVKELQGTLMVFALVQEVHDLLANTFTALSKSERKIKVQ